CTDDRLNGCCAGTTLWRDVRIHDLGVEQLPAHRWSLFSGYILEGWCPRYLSEVHIVGSIDPCVYCVSIKHVHVVVILVDVQPCSVPVEVRCSPCLVWTVLSTGGHEVGVHVLELLMGSVDAIRPEDVLLEVLVVLGYQSRLTCLGIEVPVLISNV